MDKELPEKQGFLLEMYDERAFSRDAIRELPELARGEESPSHSGCRVGQCCPVGGSEKQRAF